MTEISFSDLALPTSGALALPEFADGARSDFFAAVDKATGGALTRAAEAASFTFKRGATCVVLAPGANLERVVLVGLGDRDSLTETSAEQAGGTAAQTLSMHAQGALSTAALDPKLAVHVALGASLGLYRFDRYRTTEKKDDKPKLASLAVLTKDAAGAKAAWTGWEAVAKGVTLTRDLVSEPANVLTPIEFAKRTEALKELGVDVEVFDVPALEKLKFGSMLGVAQGSDNPPRMVVMRWNGAGDDSAPLAFVGKGVTFDSGGISIKPAAGMEDMKWDMAGAGVVTGLMAALAGRKAKVNAVGLIGLVENMVSGNAQRPGDVVRSASGQTIEVLNTDAEGRLVLADVLWYARETFSPRYMVDLATLTGAIIVGLGHEYAGLFSNDDTLSSKLTDAGTATEEKLWRMPMGEEYDKQLKSDIADMKNIGGGRAGGSITAAQFLKRFVGETPWAHLDIAGVAWATKAKSGSPKGASGFGVRLLDRFTRQFEG